VSTSLAVKLVLTPGLVILASLVARRWGSRVGGWVVGFPFTSAPIALVLVVEHGTSFAAAAAIGTMLGVLSQAAFALAYAFGARSTRPVAFCLAVATVSFAAATAVLSRAPLPALLAAFVVALGLTLALVVSPRESTLAHTARRPRWDLLARAVVTTAFVVLLTALAGFLGPLLTGLVTPFPLYATVLAVFAHVQEGPGAAIAVMRGLLTGLYGFAAFFLALALVLGKNAPLAFAAALVAVLVVQAIALRWLGPRQVALPETAR
jgi:hypothetical protein